MLAGRPPLSAVWDLVFVLDHRLLWCQHSPNLLCVTYIQFLESPDVAVIASDVSYIRSNPAQKALALFWSIYVRFIDMSLTAVLSFLNGIFHFGWKVACAVASKDHEQVLSRFRCICPDCYLVSGTFQM